jgi:tetratricopeptide (TPR) repeat protein
VAENPRIEDLRRRLEKEPGSRIFAQLAEELRKEGDFAEAIRVCRAGLGQHPNYPSARMTLGRALFDSGDLPAARGEFEAVLRGAPDNILASRFLAESLEAMGDLGSALLQYRAALRMAPGDRFFEVQIRALEQKLTPPRRSTEAAAPARGPGIPSPRSAPAAGAARAAPPAPPPAPPSAPLVARPVRSAPATREAAFEFEENLDPSLDATLDATLDGTLQRTIDDRAPTGPRLTVAVSPEKPSRAPDQKPQMGTRPVPAIAPPVPRSVPAPAAPPPLPPVAPAPVAAPAPAPEPARAAEAGDAPPIASSTLAELYLRQGFVDRAMEVYRQLLQREPGNERARARMEELSAPPATSSAGVASASPPAAPPDERAARRRDIERTIARLEELLATVRRHAPVGGAK